MTRIDVDVAMVMMTEDVMTTGIGETKIGKEDIVMKMRVRILTFYNSKMGKVCCLACGYYPQI